jgi:6,7-dimethyl-8-ribityllumazine synthase
MSDRYETPRWGDEPKEFESDNVVADEESAVEVEESELDAASENVLDGWPAAETAEVDIEAASDVSDFEEAGAEDGPLEADIALDAPATDPEEAPEPLADHVSATMEHAPGELTVPPGYAVLEGEAAGERRAVGIVVARFNGDVTTQLLESALAELDARGVARDAVTVMPVPGAFELPLAAMALAKTRRFACIVALGCVIRGDTPHFDYVSSEAASGLQLAAIETGVPVAFGLLTLDRADQAESRYDKGAEAVRTGLEMADVFANLRAAAAR